MHWLTATTRACERLSSSVDASSMSMSALGQKRKSRSIKGMSALPPEADIRVTHRHVC